MTTEEEAIRAAENRIAESDAQPTYEERYKHLVQAHREQARRSVEIERERNEAVAAAVKARQECDEQFDEHMARETGMQNALVGLQRQQQEWLQLLALVIQKTGSHVEISDKAMAEAPRLMLTSWREELRSVTVYRVDELVARRLEERDDD